MSVRAIIVSGNLRGTAAKQAPRVARAVTSACILLMVGCSSTPQVGVPPRTLVAWFRPDAVDASLTDMPELLGSWDGFARPGRADWKPLTDKQGGRWLKLEVALAPGVYQYG